MKTTFIYSLSCPISGDVKYIGKANNPKSRLGDHRRVRDNNKLKNTWIKGLLEQKLSPILSILEEVDVDEWKEKEKYYISKYDNLLNICGGANGSYFGNSGSFKGEHARKVVSLNKDGSFNKEYVSVKEARLEYGSGITSVLSGKTKTAYGYIWFYKDIYEKLTEEEISKIVSDANNNMSKVSWKNGLVNYQRKKGDIPPNRKKVYQYTIDKIYVTTWESTWAASRSLCDDIKYQGKISMCANGKRKSAYGFKWSYELLK